MAGVLQGKRIAILATNGVERRELEQPRAALSDAGADTQLLSLKPGTIDARDHDLQPAGEFSVDCEVSEASVDDFHALVFPAGVDADNCEPTPQRWRLCTISSSPANRWASYAMARGHW